ncbi:hypothetical protein [Micromonospora robiginosa]|uniref:Uncharacterized protein n=1 Tax=Micromonospora robiginosa TaxID=2749844 RepID=A0A7L6B5S6_9ACTN|nr:hypothetical protein [Micromonospora ferruginea]QLQ37306.1 hypothetical protein H1D33_29510 [Micromonospora ferruginea]
MLRLIGPAQTPAQRHLSDIDVRGYERVDDYIDPGTAPDEARAAVAIFVGPPDDDVLARVSGPGLVLSIPPNDQVFPGLDMVGRGRWHGCFVHVNRWQASDPPSASDKLTAEQAAAFRAGRLSVLDVAVGCGDG